MNAFHAKTPRNRKDAKKTKNEFQSLRAAT